MRKLFLLLFICVYVGSLHAERVNVDIAQRIAENVISESSGLRTPRPEKLSLAYVAYPDRGTAAENS